MRLAWLLIGVAYLTLASLPLWWICKRLPAGWRRNLNGATAAIVLFGLAYFGWQETLWHFTRATFVCVECGRTEDQRHFAGWTWSRTLLDDGEQFQRRFPGAVAKAHEHDWHLESCLYYEMGLVACTKECIEGWFHVLPMLKDRDEADQLAEQAHASPRDERCRLMSQFDYVWFEVREGKDPDAAVAEMLAQHPRK